jgi:hypothetical protein
MAASDDRYEAPEIDTRNTRTRVQYLFADMLRLALNKSPDIYSKQHPKITD